SAQLEIERVAHRLDLPERIQAIGFGDLFGDGRVHLRPGSSPKDRHPKKNQNDQPAQHPSALLSEQTIAILPMTTTSMHPSSSAQDNSRCQRSPVGVGTHPTSPR